jgi:hypothetical protein
MACCCNYHPYQIQYDYGDYKNSNSQSNGEVLLLRYQTPSTVAIGVLTLVGVMIEEACHEQLQTQGAQHQLSP